MKKVILFAAILFAGISVVKAEDPAVPSTVLSVKLNPVQSIEVNSGAVALIEYAAPGDYNSDKVQTSGNTVITVYSAGKFNVNVSAADLEQVGKPTNKILANSIAIEAILKEGTTIGTVKNLLLGNSKASLISSDKGGNNLKYDVKFTGKGRNYMSIFNNGGSDEAQTYTTTVYYTIAAN